MSIAAPLVTAAPPRAADLRRALDDVTAAVDVLVGVDASSVADTAAFEGVRRLNDLAARLASVRLALVARVDECQAAARGAGATSTSAWLRSQGSAPGDAHRDVRLATSLRAHVPTREALAGGAISMEQADVITSAVDRLSDAVDDADRAAAEGRLLAAAAWSDPVQLRKLAALQAARLDPSASGDLATREREMVARRELTVSRSRDGMHRLVGWFDPVGAAQLLAVLDPLSTPRPVTPAGRDERSPARRRADALLDMARLAGSADQPVEPDRARPTVLVTIDLDTLAERLRGAGHVLAGPLAEPISAAAVRRLACDAAIVPALLGGPSAELDLGRRVRSATAAQRLALVRRDGCTCAFPGCDRPFGWTDAHHVRHWSEGGRTSVDNMVLLCGAHHDTVHHGAWTVRMGADRRPVFHPPSQAPPDG